MGPRNGKLKSFASSLLAITLFAGCASQNPCGPYQGYPSYPYAQPYPAYPAAPGVMQPGTVQPGVPGPTYGVPMGTPAAAGYPGMAPGTVPMPGGYANPNGVQPLLGR